MEKISGKEIYLGPVLEEYYEEFARFMNDLEATVYTNTVSDIFRPQEEREYLTPGEDKRQFAVFLRESDLLLGIVELFNINWVHRSCELGIMLGEPSGRNRGYGYEAIMLALDYAFEILNLNSVHLIHGEFNHRGHALYLKCGFKDAGRLRNHRIFGREFYDTIYMDILAEEHEPYLLGKDLRSITKMEKK